MKAAVWYRRRDIRIEEFADPPTPVENEVKIQVRWCGICGTDLEEYMHGPFFIPVGKPDPLTGRMAPMILGHEFVGTVVEIGSGVSDLNIGDVVSPDTLIHCGKCYWCQRHFVNRCENLAILGLTTDGGLAEYVNVPCYMCFKLPERVSPEVGALAEPTSVAVRANRRVRTSCGETVAVVGAGTIGLLCLQVARRSEPLMCMLSNRLIIDEKSLHGWERLKQSILIALILLKLFGPSRMVWVWTLSSRLVAMKIRCR